MFKTTVIGREVYFPRQGEPGTKPERAEPVKETLQGQEEELAKTLEPDDDSTTRPRPVRTSSRSPA